MRPPVLTYPNNDYHGKNKFSPAASTNYKQCIFNVKKVNIMELLITRFQDIETLT